MLKDFGSSRFPLDSKHDADGGELGRERRVFFNGELFESCRGSEMCAVYRIGEEVLFDLGAINKGRKGGFLGHFFW